MCACLPSLLFHGQGRTFQCWECLVGFGSFGCSVPLLGNQHHRRNANEWRLTRWWHDVGILDEMFMQALPQPRILHLSARSCCVCRQPRQARRSESLLSCACVLGSALRVSLTMWLHRSAGLGLFLPQESTFVVDEKRAPVLNCCAEFGIGG